MQINKDGGQKSFKQFGLFSLSFLLLTSSLLAGSFENFKRTQNAEFTKYRDSRDNEFNNYLKAQWEEYTGKDSSPLYEKAKPKNITPTVQKKIKSLGPLVNIKVTKIIKKDEVTFNEQKNKDVNFMFFGQSVGFNIDSKFKSAKFYPLNQSGISNFFDTLASSDYEDTIRDVKTISQTLGLNDWGVYLLVNKLSETLFSTPDDRKLFSWFLFNKLGYEVKIGLSGRHVVLMHYSEKIIYATPVYTFNKQKFYVLSHYSKASPGRVYTYKQSYPDANKALDLSLKTLPNFQHDLRTKTLSFKQLGKEFSTSYNYNKNIIDFMATYPQADYETYFNAPMYQDTYKSIANDLKKYLDGKKSSVAINFVLNFVQNAFSYEVDQVQFGREKVMFADETLFYDKSDCEDRAVLFANLTKELFGVSVIGVKYTDHMATALYIPMKGDSVKAGKRRYVIADPTYINANIGQSMPKYKSIIPQKFIIMNRGKK